MDYTKLVDTYRKLESTQSTLEKTSILAEFFEEAGEDLPKVVLLAMGRSFPEWKDLELGISSQTMVDIISEATGKTEKEIEEVWKEEGDLGSTAEKLIEQEGGQQTLMKRELTVERINEKLEKVARMSEKSLESVSMAKKKKEVASLLNDSEPEQGKYIVRTFLENLRLGVGEGIVRDALTETFFDGDYAEEVQRAYDLTNDYQEVAEACMKGLDELNSLEIEIFRPIKSMLAKKVETVENGFDEVGKPAAVNYKYDGVRAQIHRKGDRIKIFTRRLEDVTEQFPDVVDAVKKNIEAENFILDSEIVAYNPESGSTIPFQQLSKRVRRKYDIEKMAEEIPVELRPFDLIMLEESLIDQPYKQRFSKLEEIVSESKREVRLADHQEVEDINEVRKIQKKSHEEGHEGIMMKSLEAAYKPGKRVGYMVKLKPVMETLDAAIIGAEWSEGRRSGWLGSLKLGAYDPEKDEYKEIGRMATGLTDEQLEEVTRKLEPLIVEESGRDVVVRPEVIVEVEYEEIQKSPNYSSGYALRFPRMKQFREDKEESDNITKVKNLYQNQ